MPMPVALSRFGQVAWTFALVWHLASLPAPPLMAAQSSERSSQSSDRIWGLVHTTDGERHEGFLRFERTQRAASWTDVLVGRREIPDANYHAWLQAVHDGEVALRTVELKGYRISWEERHRDFAIEEWSQVRVGQLAAIDVHDDGRVTLTPRGPAGPVVWKVPTGARFMRVVIEVPGGGDDLALGSDELDRIEFGGPPDGVVAGSRRVQGTLEDRFGREFTGVVSWNRSPVFGSHHVHGRDDEGDDWRIPFTEISVLERRLGGALITTVDGERVDLYRGLASRRQPSDVRWYRRAIRIADPGIGTVTVAWDDLRTLRVHAESNAARYEGFSVGGALYGVVTVRSGEQVEGWLRVGRRRRVGLGALQRGVRQRGAPRGVWKNRANRAERRRHCARHARRWARLRRVRLQRCGFKRRRRTQPGDLRVPERGTRSTGERRGGRRRVATRVVGRPCGCSLHAGAAGVRVMTGCGRRVGSGLIAVIAFAIAAGGAQAQTRFAPRRLSGSRRTRLV